jgi:KaiC/GvpD/RAD55 family RecA-like ATPase
MQEPATEMTDSSPHDRDIPAEELVRSLGIGLESARLLTHAGHTTPEAVRALSVSTLEGLGIPEEDTRRIRAAPEPSGPSSVEPTPPSAEGERAVSRWMDNVHRGDRTRRRHVVASPKESAQVLKRWVGGDDSALESWIQESDPAKAQALDAAAGSALPGTEDAAGLAPSASGAIPSQVLEREETVVRWLTGLLDRVKSDQFDPTAMIQEVQELHRLLYDERSRRKQLEDEVEHVKRGSIAVIKYVRSREAKERELSIQAKDSEIAELRLRLLAFENADPAAAERVAAAGSVPVPSGERPPSPAPVPSANTEIVTREVEHRMREEFADREHDFIERETELRRRIVQLEGEVRNLRAGSERTRDTEQLLARERGNLPEEVAQRLQEVDSRERDLVVRENELRAKFEEIRISAEDIERKRAPLEFKEQELANWEHQIQTQRMAIEAEARRVEQVRQEVEAGGSFTSVETSRRLDDLRNELTRKEEELKSRETAIHERMGELEKLTRKAADIEAEQIHSAIVAEAQETKVKSGVRRLDDLMYGGFPLGVQILVNGPAHTGKDVLARLFISEGLKQGIPAIWVVTDKTYTQIRDEMLSLYPAYAEAEKKGMVRYVDLYSRSLGVQQADTGVRLLAATDKGVLEQLAQAVNGFSSEYKEKFSAYRLVFESVSTVTAYLDTTATFRFLQPFTGRRKLDGAASYYVLETGMHTESDLETLEHMVDGSINLKIEQLKTFLSVRGIAETQSRAWIGYTFTKKSFSLGSFSLDHIR